MQRNRISICICVEMDMIGNTISNMGIVYHILAIAYNVGRQGRKRNSRNMSNQRIIRML